MEEFVQQLPPHWISIPPNVKPTSVGVPPTATQIRRQGAFVRVLFDAARWLSDVHRENVALNDVVAGNLADLVKNEISTAKVAGFLFEMRVYGNAAGASKVLGNGLVPIGPGNSILDSVARSMNDGPSISIAPPQGMAYDNDRSFFVWVTKGNDGELQSKISRWPLHSYLIAKRVAFAGFASTNLEDALAERAEVFDKLADIAENKSKDIRHRQKISDLRRSRAAASASLEAAALALARARAHARKAKQFEMISTLFKLAGSALGHANDFQSKPDISSQESSVTNQYDTLILIENRLSIEIKKSDENQITPEPIPLKPFL